MDFPPSLNFLSLRERLHDAWLLLWLLLFLEGEEDLVLSLDRVLVDNDDDDEDEEDGIFLFFFFLLELSLLLPNSCWGEGKDDLFCLGGLGILLTLFLLGATSLSKEEEVSFSPFFYITI